MAITWRQALAWRAARQSLDPPVARSVPEVVRRLGAISAWPELNADLAVAARRSKPKAEDVAVALAQGRIVKTFAFRGGTFLLAPEDAGSILALRASSRMWELQSWQEHYGLTPDAWPAFREAVRAALDNGPLTHSELAEHVSRDPRYRHLSELFSYTLVKPLAWQGDLCLGPPKDGQATYQRLDVVPRWSGIPDLDVAGPAAVEMYIRAHGPTTREQIGYFLGQGLSVRPKRLAGWVDGLADRLATLEIEGRQTLLLQNDLDELSAAEPSDSLLLLPGYDPWVMGPGTKDEQVVPPAHRDLVSRGSHLLVAGGVVAGTWSLRADRLHVEAFADAKPAIDERSVAAAADRIALAMGRSLEVSVGMRNRPKA